MRLFRIIGRSLRRAGRLFRPTSAPTPPAGWFAVQRPSLSELLRRRDREIQRERQLRRESGELFR